MESEEVAVDNLRLLKTLEVNTGERVWASRVLCSTEPSLFHLTRVLSIFTWTGNALRHFKLALSSLWEIDRRVRGVRQGKEREEQQTDYIDDIFLKQSVDVVR